MISNFRKKFVHKESTEININFHETNISIKVRLFAFKIRSDIWTMAISLWVLVTSSPNQNKTNNILKFTYLQIISWITSFAFRRHIDIVTNDRSHQASITTLQTQNEINNIFDCHNHHRYFCPEELIGAKLNSYHQGNYYYQN